MTLRLKLNLILTLLLVLTNGTVAFLLVEKQRSLLSESLSQQASAITNLVSQDTLKLLVLNSPDAASDIIQKFQTVENLAHFELFNTEDKKVLNFVHPDHLHENEESLVSKDVPLKYSGETFGHLKLYFAKDFFESHLHELNTFLIQLFLIILVLTSLFAWFVDKYFTKRLTLLNQALLSTATTQDYSIKLPVNTQDEIGQAYKHFNQLVQNTDSLTSELQKQATQDNLTNLYNRFFITQKLLERFTHESFSADTTYALCYFDLDQFKIINDTYGHSIGDEFLKTLSERLYLHVEKTFTPKQNNFFLGRLGGDEFALLVEDTNREKIKDVLNQLQKLIQDFEFNYLNQTLKVTVSIGAILFDNHYTDNEALLSGADTACYYSKNKGRGHISIFDIESEELTSEKTILSWFHRIQKAIKQEDFIVYLQPIQASKKHKDQTPSYEALIRLKENGEILTPFHFIEPAERFNLTPEIDLYMVEKVVQHLQENPLFLKDIKHIAINLSGITLSSQKSAQNIIDIINQAEIPFDKLCFEVTETSALSNLSKAIEFIQQLSHKGCKFSLDDFGTGMASFDYLYKLPVNYLKIDGSFITDIAKDPVKKEMVIAMQKIAELMELETVAEFVENQEIIDELDKIGIHYHQGYHYSAPQPFKTFLK